MSHSRDHPICRLVRTKERYLLAAAEEEGFEIFITGGKGIRFEQNLADRKIAIVVLSTTDWMVLKDARQHQRRHMRRGARIDHLVDLHG
jgi:hypothetical protein